MDLDSFLRMAASRNPGEPEFLQAVTEVTKSLDRFIRLNPKYDRPDILERLIEPERTIIFRVPWVDDYGVTHINRGYRVQMNSAIGPYKGGLRFHPSVNLSIMKFLAYEQVFKNSLTTLPIGGAKGGADFNGIDRSDTEIMRFCQSFITELYRHIGPELDVPAGDIGVGSREIGYMFGQYKRISNQFCGTLTGKGLSYGGSLIRTEATGYGVTYFLREMLNYYHDDLENKTVAISGYGNVGTYCIEKINELGGKVVTIADEHGYVYDKDGIRGEKLDYIRDLWVVRRHSAQEYAKEFKLPWIEGKRPWYISCDIAMPTATQNELLEEHAKELVKNGCRYVVEGANMPSSIEAVRVFDEANIHFAPGKAANAGGVSVSCLEMSQNAMHYNWSRQEVDKKLKQIMCSIHENCLEYGREDGRINYARGANIAGFIKVADAMIAQGVV